VTAEIAARHPAHRAACTMAHLLVALLAVSAVSIADAAEGAGACPGLSAAIEGYLLAAEPEGVLPVPDYSGDWTSRAFLSGDWGGKRTDHANRGVTLELDWLQVVQGVVSGGTDEAWEYVTNLDLYANVDLARMNLVPGALVSMRAQSRFGETVNSHTGLLLPVNTYSAFPFTSTPDDDVPIAITELTYTQFLSEKIGLLAGKITTMKNSNEFNGGEGRSQFMNFKLIFSPVVAQVAPYSTLAAGVIWMPSRQVTVTSLLMNTADASTTTGFGDIGEGTSWATSADYQYRWADRPGGGTVQFILGFDGDFARIGGINWDPEGGVSLERKKETWVVAWSAWQYLIVRGKTPDSIDARDGRQDLEGLGVFLMAGLADTDTNPTHWSIAVGLGGRGLIPSRGSDTCGLGFFYSNLQDPRILGLIPFEDATSGLEFYYNAALTESIALSLDLQWTESAFSSVEDSFLVGVRLNARF